MRKGQDYVDSLRRLKSRVFVQGQLVDNLAEQPLFQSTIYAWGKWLCDAAFEPKLQSLMTAKSELTGEDVHIFWHMPSDTAGLLQNFDAAIKLAERVPITGYTSIARDELAGLVTAAALVRPNGVTDLTASSVKKKMKSKGFARNVKREDIERGAADFGVDLTEHIQFVIDAVKPLAGELGLERGAGGEPEV